MRQEIEQLRQQAQMAQTPTADNIQVSHTAQPPASDTVMPQAPDIVQSISGNWAAPVMGTPIALRSPPASTTMGSVHNSRDDITLARSIYSDQPRTSVQTLDGFELSPQKVDDCFAL
jgi:hypothetical protein